VEWFWHFLILVIFFFFPPWRWSYKWPKHVGGYPLIKLYQNTIERLLVLILCSVPPSCMYVCTYVRTYVCMYVTYYQTTPLLDICLKRYFYVLALTINYEAPLIFSLYLTTTLSTSPKLINKLLSVCRKPLTTFCWNSIIGRCRRCHSRPLWIGMYFRKFSERDLNVPSENICRLWCSSSMGIISL